jgi:inhibitor of KinA
MKPQLAFSNSYVQKYMLNKKNIQQVSETAIMIYIADIIDPKNSLYIAQLSTQIETQFTAFIFEVIPSYCSILIEFNVAKISYLEMASKLKMLVSTFVLNRQSNNVRVIELPVYYDQQVAPDLVNIATAKNMSTEQVIAIHSQQTYSVCAIGFAPGFAFLGSVNDKISMPRHKKPRLMIPKGSVGITEKQTAVYPDSSPGGWQIIGNCPSTLFNPNSEQMMPFSIGDNIKFTPIDKSEFLSLGGEICQDWK